MSADIVIKTNKLSCLSGSQFLLNSISWQVEKGDQWVVFGRNGCGKTTLLSIIAGYKSYTSGELEVFGQKYDANNILAIRKKSAGSLPLSLTNIINKNPFWILFFLPYPAH